MNHWTENYWEEKNNMFFEQLYCFLITFFEKICAIREFRF